MKKTWSTVMAAVMAGSLLAGCSGQKAAETTAAASAETTAVAASEVAETTAAAGGENVTIDVWHSMEGKQLRGFRGYGEELQRDGRKRTGNHR